VKVGISFVSEEGALNNLKKEIDHWDFDKVKQLRLKTTGMKRFQN
jgi:putative alpha-1,2-mannosidase